jgi:hypothetical protein
MLSRLRSHVRHNAVGYVALFFALTGVAYAAGPLKAGDPAGGDLTGTYPNPSIAANAVNSGKVSDGSLTGSDIDESTLGKVGDADTLDSFDSTDYGAVLMGRLNALGQHVFVVWGEPSGSFTAPPSGDLNPHDVSAVTPDHDLKARDLSVQLTAAPGGSISRTFYVWLGDFSGGPALQCTIQGSADSCTASGPGAIPANSEISVGVLTNSIAVAPADARFAFRLTP